MIDQVAEKVVRRVILGFLLGGLLLLSYAVLHMFIVPVAWAVILAFATWPAYRRLRASMRRYPTLSALLMTLLLSAAFVLPALWMGMLLRTEVGVAITAVTAQIKEGSLALPDFVRSLPWIGDGLQALIEDLTRDPEALRAQMTEWVRQGSDLLDEQTSQHLSIATDLNHPLILALDEQAPPPELSSEALQTAFPTLGPQTQSLTLWVLPLRNRNGELYWVNSMMAPVFNVHGEIEKYVSIRFDITQRKRAERRLAAQFAVTQALAERRQRIIDARRHNRIDGARHEPLLFQLAQLLGQHALGHCLQPAAQLAEAQRAIDQEMIEDHALPFAVEKAERRLDRAAWKFVGHLGAWSRHGQYPF